jgi:hypothetical protein
MNRTKPESTPDQLVAFCLKTMRKISESYREGTVFNLVRIDRLPEVTPPMWEVTFTTEEPSNLYPYPYPHYTYTYRHFVLIEEKYGSQPARITFPMTEKVFDSEGALIATFTVESENK